MTDQNNSKFARDQLGDPWIIFEHNLSEWAVGMPEDGVCRIYMVHDGVVQMTLEKPNAFRRLRFVDETPKVG